MVLQWLVYTWLLVESCLDQVTGNFNSGAVLDAAQVILVGSSR
jgi:hypothetical protein